MKILDCTLRDGGYYNNWNFSTKLVNEYLNTMSGSGVDTVELGFRLKKKITPSAFKVPIPAPQQLSLT